MSKRTKWLLAIGVIATLVFGWQVFAFASHGDQTLPGSNFEIDDDANLKVDHDPPSTDWIEVSEAQGTDAPSGSNDDSYKGGAKEDDPCPDTTTGSIPNNKSDLKTFGAYVEPGSTSTDPGFLNLYWTRVQDPSGTTLMDFELNQSSEDCGNGVNPVRTEGDLLIEYRIEQGGSTATIKVREWTGTAWGPAEDLTAAALASGTINNTAIPAGESDIGALDARTFGEAQLDLDFIFDENECESFGSAFVKSRASDSFTSQMKDYIEPVPVDIQNCGNIIINKVTVPDPDPTDTTFNYTTEGGLVPATFGLKNGETQDYNDEVTAGSYSVTETDPGPDFVLTDIECTADSGSSATPDVETRTVDIELQAQDTVECTFTNELQRGALLINKNSTKTGNAVLNVGAVFSYNDSSVTDNGAGDGDDTVGVVCVSGLATGDYTINETTPPDGYGGASQTDQTATVVAGTNCGANPPTGAAVVTFTNPPLADIQVNFRDGGSGETALEEAGIVCDNVTGSEPDETPADGWDASDTVTGIHAGSTTVTVTCTIPIDP